MRWYVSRAGSTEGPLEEDEVRRRAKADALRGAQVRDEQGGAWLAAEMSPFGSLMKARGWTGPVVAGVVTTVPGFWFSGMFFATLMPERAAMQAAVLGGIVSGLLTFGALALARRI